MKNQAIIFQGKNGGIELRSDSNKQTIWATQAQVVSLFCVDQSVVSRHIKNIFKDGEVSEKSNMQKMHIANSDKPVVLYSLDVILAVGYRTNSSVAIEFRKWATKVLKDHVTKGFTVNKKVIQKNHQEFLEAVEMIKKTLPTGDVFSLESTLDLVKLFASTWFSLDAYDKGDLNPKTISKKKVELTAGELVAGVAALKKELLKYQ
jgi:prophage antirepressor-like protein